MHLDVSDKSEIQYFVYVLFRGTLDHRLIGTNYDYLDKLLANHSLLYSCFEVFAYAAGTSEDGDLEKVVANYIIGLHEDAGASQGSLLFKAREFNANQDNYWTDFLQLARCFCLNTFPDPVSRDYLAGMNGVGSDPLAIFAFWTNVVEIDNDEKVTNSEYSLRRTNERIKAWDGRVPSKKFEPWEMEQELY
jgi:hypothetical protein